MEKEMMEEDENGRKETTTTKKRECFNCLVERRQIHSVLSSPPIYDVELEFTLSADERGTMKLHLANRLLSHIYTQIQTQTQTNMYSIYNQYINHERIHNRSKHNNPLALKINFRIYCNNYKKRGVERERYQKKGSDEMRSINVPIFIWPIFFVVLPFVVPSSLCGIKKQHTYKCLHFIHY